MLCNHDKSLSNKLSWKWYYVSTQWDLSNTAFLICEKALWMLHCMLNLSIIYH